MSYDNVKNFAIGTLSSGISDSDTSLTLDSGQGARFPNPPFNIVIWDSNNYNEPHNDPNVEIARVTAKSGDIFTIARGQEGTNASSHSAGCRVELNLTAKVIQDIIDGKVNQSTQTTTIYVDADSGDDTNGDGSEANPYQTLDRAFQDIPSVVNHKYTISVKSATAKYSTASLKNRIAGNENGEIIIQGEASVLDSGTVGSVTENADDPSYGSNAPVDKLTDSSKSWTTNAYQGKLLRVYKTGETDQYRIIISNDSTSLYVSHHFDPVPDNTWSYQILDWDSILDTLTLENLRVPITIELVKFDPSSSYGLHGTADLPKLTIKKCYGVGGSGEIPLYFNACFGTVDIQDCYIEKTGTSWGDWGLGAEQTTLLFFVNGVIFKNGKAGIYIVSGNAFLFMKNGTRILSPSDYGVYATGVRGDLWSDKGKTVIDNVGIGFYVRLASAFTNTGTSYLYFNSVTTQWDDTDNFSSHV